MTAGGTWHVHSTVCPHGLFPTCPPRLHAPQDRWKACVHEIQPELPGGHLGPERADQPILKERASGAQGPGDTQMSLTVGKPWCTRHMPPGDGMSAAGQHCAQGACGRLGNGPKMSRRVWEGSRRGVCSKIETRSPDRGADRAPQNGRGSETCPVTRKWGGTGSLHVRPPAALGADSLPE